MQRTQPATHILLLLAVGSVWGLQPAFIKLATAGPFDEALALSLMMIGVTALAGVYLGLSGRPAGIARATLKFLIVCATLEYAAPLYVAFLVAGHIDAGLLTLIIATTPVFTVGLSAILGRDRLTLKSLSACLLGIAAMALLVIPENALPSRDMLPWCFAAFAVPVFYASGSLYVAQAWPQGFDAMQVAFGGSLFASLMLAPVWTMPLASGELAGLSLATAAAIAALAVLMVLEMVMYFYLLQNAGAVFTSFSSFVMLVSGFIAGALLFQEQPTPWVVASVLLFAGALGLVVLAPARHGDA